jgi:hypothetical protein
MTLATAVSGAETWLIPILLADIFFYPLAAILARGKWFLEFVEETTQSKISMVFGIAILQAKIPTTLWVVHRSTHQDWEVVDT